MKIPLSPPSLKKFLESDNTLSKDKIMLLVGSSIGPYDDKGRYLHWDELRHKNPPEGYDQELYWLAMRLARSKISKELAFRDKAQAPFTYSIPDGVMRDLLWISENATGAIAADPQISDSRTKRTYIISSLIEEAINSSQLEGASTTRRVAKEMIRTGREPENTSEKMILNNYNAMFFIQENKEDQLTPSMLFELHKILTEGTLLGNDEGKSGMFRGDGDEVGVYSHDDILVHSPPEAKELEHRLQLICDFANKVGEEEPAFIPPIIRAIIVHFMIGYDHPFIDGNGRVARALFYWVMAREGYWLMEYISISRVVKKAPAKYMYAYLYTETDNNDLTYFIVHQLGVITEAISDLHKYLVLRSDQLTQAEKILDNSPLRGELNRRQLSLLKHALKNPGSEYTYKSHKTSHGIAYQTARTDLLKLSDKYQIFKKYKVGKTDVFIAPPNLRELIKQAG